MQFTIGDEKFTARQMNGLDQIEVVSRLMSVGEALKEILPKAMEFARKAAEFLLAGVHLLVVDLFPPSRRDPQGVHKLIWDRIKDEDYALPPDKPLTLVPGAVDDANAFLEANALTRERFDRVGRLVEGFETPFGLELLATVHWVARHESPGRKSADVVERTYAWNDRKRQFTPRQIGIALKVLSQQGWIAPLRAEEAAA